jgi:uncharacterized protein
MDNQEVIKKTEDFVKQTLAHQEGAHDWWHIDRVRRMGLHLAKEEKADLFVVELATLLHDIADAKFYNGDSTIGPKKTREWLESQSIDSAIIDHVAEIVSGMSYSSSLEGTQVNQTREFQVVQDADRLDAIGAIGLARVFAYAGYKGNAIYDPTIQPRENLTSEQYKKSPVPAVTHIYEKLLKLKGLMNTETARQIADKRHQFMELFLKEFYKEEQGEK